MTRGAKVGTGVGIGALVALGTMSVLRPAPSVASAPPTEAQLRDFARLTPITFRSAIATLERKSPPLSPHPVPLAVGIADGIAVRILKPAGVSGGHYNCFLGQLHSDGTYIAPRVPYGSAIETARYIAPGRTRELRLVLAGKRGTARQSDGFDYDALLTEGESTMRDLGALPTDGSRYGLEAPGSTSDGFAIAQTGGAAPRRIALAPAELPPTTRPEPGGYALQFDRVVLWGRRESRTTNPPVHGKSFAGPLVPFLPAALRDLIWHPESFTATERDYRVSGLAHVYVRQNGRWLYARTWSLDGHGTAWQTDHAPAFRRSSLSPPHVTIGAPDQLIASRTEPFTP